MALEAVEFEDTHRIHSCWAARNCFCISRAA